MLLPIFKYVFQVKNKVNSRQSWLSGIYGLSGVDFVCLLTYLYLHW